MTTTAMNAPSDRPRPTPQPGVEALGRDDDQQDEDRAEDDELHSSRPEAVSRSWSGTMSSDPDDRPEPVRPPAEDAHHDDEQRQVRWNTLSTVTNPICSAKTLPPIPPSSALATMREHLVAERRHAQPLGHVLGVVDREQRPAEAECWITNATATATAADQQLSR